MQNQLLLNYIKKKKRSQSGEQSAATMCYFGYSPYLISLPAFVMARKWVSCGEAESLKAKHLIKGMLAGQGTMSLLDMPR